MINLLVCGIWFNGALVRHILVRSSIQGDSLADFIKCHAEIF